MPAFCPSYSYTLLEDLGAVATIVIIEFLLHFRQIELYQIKTNVTMAVQMSIKVSLVSNPVLAHHLAAFPSEIA